MKTANPLTDKEKFPRQDPEIPWEVTTAELTNLKAKHSGTFRRTLMRSRARVIEMPVTPRKSFETRLDAWARGLNVVQLQRRAPRYQKLARHFDRELTRLGNITVEGVFNYEATKLERLKESFQLALFDAWSHYNAVVNEAKRRGALIK